LEGRAAVERGREAEITGVVLLDLLRDAAAVERGVLGVLRIEADIGPHGLDEAGVLAGLGVGRLERLHRLREVEQHGIVKERPLLVVDAQAVVDQADIGGVAAGGRELAFEAHGVERLLGRGKARRQQGGRQEHTKRSALHGCTGCH
jgi:hypothetical protein